MRRFQSLYSVVLLALLSSLTLVGCRDALFDRSFPDCTEQQEAEVTPGTLEGAVTMTLGYESHALKTPGTLRAALSIKEESDLKLATTRVLIFNSNGEYQYDAPLTKITPDESDHQKGTLTVQIKPGQGLGIVVLANLSKDDKVRPVSGTKAEILKSFAYSVAQDTDFSSVGIPMFGEVTQVEVKTDTQPVPTLGDTIPLLRAVARVDVGLQMSAVGTTGKDADFDETASGLISTIVEPADGSSKKVKWTLLETKFYNAASEGLVVPAEANYKLDGSKLKATAPTLPQTPGKQTLTYAVTGNLLKRNIYIPETGNPEPEVTQNGNETDPTKDTYYSNRPYLILKLQYEEVDDANKVKTGVTPGTTYFRVDFLKREGKEATAKYTYLPLLRNHRYKVDIRNIGGLGFDNEDDAKEGPSANIMYNVLVWDESEMSDVKYDGQYMLGVSQDEITFSKEADELVSIKVQTSWNDGFDVKNLPDWIEVADIKPAKEGANAKTDEKVVTFRVTKSTDKERKWLNTEDHDGAYIQAGRMRWNLSFIQKNTLNLDIAIFSDPECTKPLQYIALDERGTNTPENEYTYGRKKFYVKVTPAARISEVTDETKTPFIFSSNGSTGSDQVPIASAVEISTGVFEFEVTAEPLSNPKNPFESRQNTYHFITEQKGVRDQADLTVNQTEYNIVFYEDAELTKRFEGDLEGFYSMDGGLKSIYVKSNIPYEVWLDNQTIDKSVRSTANSTTVDGVEGYSITPIVTHWVKQGTSQEVEVDYAPAKWYKVKHEATSTPNGSELKFRVQGDPKNLEILYGHVKWVAGTPLPSMQWKFPIFDGTNHDEVSMASCAMIAAKEIPEANSFQVTLGRIGVLIPLARINHAADFYEHNFDSPYQFTADDYSHKNDKTAKLSPSENWDSYKKRNMLNRLAKDDKIELEVLWTDIKSVTEKSTEADRNPIKVDGTAPLRALSEITIRGERYAFVLFGDNKPDNSGNLVFCVRSPDKSRVDNQRGELLDPHEQDKDPILWSFHLMIYEQGKIPRYTPTVDVTSNQKVTQYKKDEEYNKIWPREVYSLPCDLGAFEMPVRYHGNAYRYVDYKYRRVGLTYQFGRKDPFPRWKNAEEKPTRLVGHQGKEIDFTFRFGYTISMRESIEFPMVMAGNSQGHQWLTEGGKASNKTIGLAGTSAFGSYGLWGGGAPLGNESTASDRVYLTRMTNKTVFDPSPYGFCVPAPGYSFTYAILNEENRQRLKWNFVVWAASTSGIEYVNLYKSRNDPDNLFSICKTNSTGGLVGQNMLAVSTSYTGQAHYPIILMTYGAGSINERYQNDVTRCSPICVRPFNYTPESDWQQYLQF